MSTTIDDYLGRLDAALAAVPHGTAREIREGVEEELRSLDGAAADERMRALGSPEEIAAAATGTLHEQPTPSSGAAAPARPNGTASPVYVVLTALAIAIGLWVVPIVGWIAGIVLLWASVAWRRWEKIVATVMPVAALGLLVTSTALTPRIDAMTSTNAYDSDLQVEFDAPGVEPFAASNPFLPSGFDLFWTGAVGIAVLCFATAAWLLVVAFRRGLAPVSPARSGRAADPLMAIGATMLITGLLAAVGLYSVFANPLTALSLLPLAIAGLVLLVIRAVTRR